MKTIVIDDSRAIRRLLCGLLKGLDIETIEAEDGCDALSRLGSENADDIALALVDWDMPRMTGIEFVRELRSCPEYSGTKIMMVTSHNDPEDLMAAVQTGADEFLMKPFDEQMFKDKLRLLGMLN